MVNIEVPQLPSFNWVIQPEIPETTNQQATEFQEFMSKFEESDKVSPFLITHFIENRTTLIYTEFLISLKTDQSLISAGINNFNENDELKVNEKFVHNKIDKICDQPLKHKVVFNQEFYDENGMPLKTNDLTLGKYIEMIM